MRVVSVPGRLRLAIALTALAIPMAAIETAMALRAPWWDLPYRAMCLWSVAIALVTVPLSLFIAAGRSWALLFLGVVNASWTLGSAWVAIHQRDFWLGVFVLIIGMYCLVVYWWIRFEIKRSFFDPRVAWYQGIPRPIAGLGCYMLYNGRNVKYKVSRLDRDGAFIFTADGKKMDWASKHLNYSDAVELIFESDGAEVRCHGMAVRIIESGAGMGIRFSGLSRDTRKELGDFVERLHGKGYVE